VGVGQPNDDSMKILMNDNGWMRWFYKWLCDKEIFVEVKREWEIEGGAGMQVHVHPTKKEDKVDRSKPRRGTVGEVDRHTTRVIEAPLTE
jgi:hypothetical protein